MLFTWFLTKMLIEKEARIFIDQLELKLSIKAFKGDLGSVLVKILKEEEFQADPQFRIYSDESYGIVDYQGTASSSKFSAMIADMMYQYHKNSILEYFYGKANEITGARVSNKGPENLKLNLKFQVQVRSGLTIISFRFSGLKLEEPENFKSSQV